MTPHEELIYDIIGKVQDVENKERSLKSKRGKFHRLAVDGVERQKPVYLRLGTPLFGYKNVSKEWKVDRESQVGEVDV